MHKGNGKKVIIILLLITILLLNIIALNTDLLLNIKQFFLPNQANVPDEQDNSPKQSIELDLAKAAYEQGGMSQQLAQLSSTHMSDKQDQPNQKFNSLKWIKYKPILMEEQKKEHIENYKKNLKSFISLYDYKNNIIEWNDSMIKISNEECTLNFIDVHHAHINISANLMEIEENIVELLYVVSSIICPTVYIIGPAQDLESSESVDMAIISLIVSKLIGCMRIYIQNISKMEFNELYSDIISKIGATLMDKTLRHVSIVILQPVSIRALCILMENIVTPNKWSIIELKIQIPNSKEWYNLSEAIDTDTWKKEEANKQNEFVVFIPIK
ncbi:hypothetical protein NEFER03_1938 [Nematocida sp. LUAm3]|nr:hypothetical protein NEFER03_1938 [Nematocida sp. LUAm3]KAI5176160.1 hypothetical protein NEFER02_1974 [Nematocida sp. LUAm2]KAI5179254.1 hypothetical protein NEFER01_2106 [Nematocida sp. LUAm1]